MTSTVTFGLIDGYTKVGNKVIVFLFSPQNRFELTNIALTLTRTAFNWLMPPPFLSCAVAGSIPSGVGCSKEEDEHCSVWRMGKVQRPTERGKCHNQFKGLIHSPTRRGVAGEFESGCTVTCSLVYSICIRTWRTESASPVCQLLRNVLSAAETATIAIIIIH